MTVQEQWKQLVDSASKISESQLLDQFIAWSDDFCGEEFDSDNAMVAWRRLDADRRHALLRSAIQGTIAHVTTEPQLDLALLFAMFQALCHRHTFITSVFPINGPHMTQLLAMVKKLGTLHVELIGAAIGHSGRHLVDCHDYDFAIADYFDLMPYLKRKPDVFKSQVQALFLLEADSCLYSNRIFVFEHSVPKATGFIYKATGTTPEDWKKSEDYLDLFSELKNLGIHVYGTVSSASQFETEQINPFIQSSVNKGIQPTAATPYTAFAFKTSEQRIAAIVGDAAKAADHVAIFALSEDILKNLKSELHKAGIEATIVSQSIDITSALAKENAPQKQVFIVAGLPSTLFALEAPTCKGTVLMAEHFLHPSMHEKIFAVSRQIFKEFPRPQLYFSITDPLFSFYEEDAQFQRLFSIIDFTEKYDPWKQVRRVLAKAMVSRLHRVRSACLHEDMPIFNTPIATRVPKMPLRGAMLPKKSAINRMEALCFCGSGKPFKECHGKKK